MPSSLGKGTVIGIGGRRRTDIPRFFLSLITEAGALRGIPGPNEFFSQAGKPGY